jgi:fission process protein 1
MTTEKPVGEKYLQETKKLLEIYDKNNDGKIDEEELKAIRADYQKHLETYKKDGKLSSSEISQMERDAEQHEHKSLMLTLFKRYDSDQDGNLDEAEVQRLHEDVKTTDTAFRYAGYTGLLSRSIATASRYLAYTSDVGESFRPVAHPRLVTASYGISWAYVFGDVGYEGYKEYKLPDATKMDVAQVVVQRSVFQVLASIVLPAITIHTQVKVFQKVFAKVGRFQKWGPTVAGIAIIPALPVVIDHPVEKGVEMFFDRFWPNQRHLRHLRKQHEAALNGSDSGTVPSASH